MIKGYYLNDKRTSYTLFRHYLYKLCKTLVLESMESVQDARYIEELAFEKMHDYFNKMKNEDAIIEGKKLKFQIVK